MTIYQTDILNKESYDGIAPLFYSYARGTKTIFCFDDGSYHLVTHWGTISKYFFKKCKIQKLVMISFYSQYRWSKYPQLFVQFRDKGYVQEMTLPDFFVSYPKDVESLKKLTSEFFNPIKIIGVDGDSYLPGVKPSVPCLKKEHSLSEFKALIDNFYELRKIKDDNFLTFYTSEKTYDDSVPDSYNSVTLESPFNVLDRYMKDRQEMSSCFLRVSNPKSLSISKESVEQGIYDFLDSHFDDILFDIEDDAENVFHIEDSQVKIISDIIDKAVRKSPLQEEGEQIHMFDITKIQTYINDYVKAARVRDKDPNGYAKIGKSFLYLLG